MTGPLAQQIAHLHGVLSDARCADLDAGGISDEEYNDALAVLSSIERHVHDMETALTGAQFCLHVEYLRYRDSVPDDPTEAVGRVEGMEILAETLNEIAEVIGPYYAGKVAALSAAPTATHQETK